MYSFALLFNTFKEGTCNTSQKRFGTYSLMIYTNCSMIMIYFSLDISAIVHISEGINSMSVTQTAATEDAFDNIKCRNCNSVLPPEATFCSTCGERVQKQSQQASTVSQVDTTNIAERYRITSLMYRSTFIRVFLAMDMLHQRAVILRDIDISSLDDDAKLQAVQAVQQEYDALRRQRIPDVTPLIDLRYFQEHLYSVAGWPFPLPEDESSKAFTYTLHDLLQSGIGLPGEGVTLAWLHLLCGAVAQLHNSDIILGNLDPATIVVSDGNYDGLPALTVSWLPWTVRSLLSPSSSSIEGPFVAPEARLAPAEPRSDIYSLGALLYLLLTGSIPDEPSPSMQRPWHRLREINPRISGSIEAIVMRALSVDVSNRFQRVEEMEEALLLALEQHSETRRATTSRPNSRKAQATSSPKDDPEEVTISIVSLQSQLARQLQRQLQNDDIQDEYTITRNAIADTPTISTAHIRNALLEHALNTPQPVGDETLQEETTAPLAEALPEPMPRSTPVPTEDTKREAPLLQRLQERITGVLPAFKAKPRPATIEPPQEPVGDANTPSWLRRVQRFLLGEQQHTTTAAALIETPLRVQPNQSYTIRISLMGREVAKASPSANKGFQPVGLSSIVRDEHVRIEVRSAIFQNYAYVAQRTDVQMPGEGFAAEVLIPMQTFSEGPSGRRERLHIFFMDEMQRPLYEKPFAIEIFVSRLVQSGREGHNVLTIPL